MQPSELCPSQPMTPWPPCRPSADHFCRQEKGTHKGQQPNVCPAPRHSAGLGWAEGCWGQASGKLGERAAEPKAPGKAEVRGRNPTGHQAPEGRPQGWFLSPQLSALKASVTAGRWITGGLPSLLNNCQAASLCSLAAQQQPFTT